jgi:hypothetical protein
MHEMRAPSEETRRKISEANRRHYAEHPERRKAASRGGRNGWTPEARRRRAMNLLAQVEGAEEATS